MPRRELGADVRTAGTREGGPVGVSGSVDHGVRHRSSRPCYWVDGVAQAGDDLRAPRGVGRAQPRNGGWNPGDGMTMWNFSVSSGFVEVAKRLEISPHTVTTYVK